MRVIRISIIEIDLSNQAYFAKPGNKRHCSQPRLTFDRSELGLSSIGIVVLKKNRMPLLFNPVKFTLFKFTPSKFTPSKFAQLIATHQSLSLSLLALGITAAFDVKAQPAQVARLPDVTVTATRTERDVLSVPASVTILTAEELEATLSTNLKDAVRYEPNLSVRKAPARFSVALSSTGRAGNEGINIRGLEGNRVRILVDGVRAPSSYSFGATSMGRGDYFDFGLIKRIEILKGSASALYGSDGLAGVMSITTRDANDFLKLNRNKAKNHYGAVNYGRSQDDNSHSFGLVSASRLNDQAELLVMLNHTEANELKNFGTNESLNSDRTAPNPTKNRRDAGLAKLSFGSGFYRGKLTIESLNSRTDTDVLSSRAKLPLTATSVLKLIANDRILKDRISFENNFQGLDTPFADDVTATVYYQQSHSIQVANEDRNTAADRVRDTTYSEAVKGLFVQANKRFTNQLISYGVDVERNDYENLVTGVVPPFGETFPLRRFPKTGFTSTALFLQDQIDLGDVSIIPALRYDSYSLKPKSDALFPVVTASNSGSSLTPKIGVLWRVALGYSVYGNVSEGFRAPAPQNVNQFFENLTSFYKTIPNPTIRPEKSLALEVGARASIANVSGQVALFRAKFKDFIEDNVQVGGAGVTGNPTIFQSVNVGRVAISGFEAKALWAITPAWSVQGGFGMTKGKDELTGQPLNSVNPSKAVIGTTFKQEQWSVGLNAVHTAAKKVSDINGTSFIAPSTPFAPAAFTAVDLFASWKPLPQLTLRAAVLNLTDQKYWFWSDVRGLSAQSTVLDAYAQPRRSASLSVRYEF